MSRARKSNGPRRRVQYYSPKRRAIMTAGEEIIHLEVFERDNWICGICRTKVDRELRQPDPLCATLDHVVPISVCLAQGWPVETIHTYTNTQLAHLSCNLKKSDKVDEECARMKSTQKD